MIQTVVGKRGTGKTSLIAELIAAQKRDQIFIFDYCGEFQGFAIDGFCYVARSGFRDFCNEAWDASREGISTLMVFDEIALYGKNNFLIEHIYRLGRHKGIDIISASQRFHILPLIVRSQTDIFHIFKLTEVRDLEYLRSYVGDELQNQIMNLDRFQYINLDL